MILTASPVGAEFAPTATAPQPLPPIRWSRWWTSPIARLDYGSASRVPLWQDATLPAHRNLTGALRASVTYAGTSLDGAIRAAHLLSATPVPVSFTYRNGRHGMISANPAIAVLRDAKLGAYWITPLSTTVKIGGNWVDAPHTIDGVAFDGADPAFVAPSVRSATRDLVAVVGVQRVVTPERWTDAPPDSRVTR